MRWQASNSQLRTSPTTPEVVMIAAAAAAAAIFSKFQGWRMYVQPPLPTLSEALYDSTSTHPQHSQQLQAQMYEIRPNEILMRAQFTQEHPLPHKLTSSGLLFAAISPDAPSFEDYFPGLEGLLARVDFTKLPFKRTLSYEGRFNWKTMYVTVPTPNLFNFPLSLSLLVYRSSSANEDLGGGAPTKGSTATKNASTANILTNPSPSSTHLPFIQSTTTGITPAISSPRIKNPKMASFSIFSQIVP